MHAFCGNIEQLSLDNRYFRKVVHTSHHSQLVVMCLQPGEDIGEETHDKEDQFIRVERGTGTALIAGESFSLSDGVAVVVPAGTRHNIINTSSSSTLHLYTIYSPAHHPEGTIHQTKQDAMDAENHHN